MIGGLVEWADRLLRSFDLVSPLKRGVSPAEEDDVHTGGTNPEPRAGAGTASQSLAKDLRDEQ